MAPKRGVKSDVNKELLSMIAAASAASSVYYVTQAEGKPLLDKGLIQVDLQNIQGDKAASRITDAGIAYLNGGASMQTTVNENTSSPYAVIKNAALPPSKRGTGLRGGAPKQYPFDTMEKGDSFFVPVSEKHPDPVKTLGSTVSSANLRYAEVTGKKMVTRNKRGKKNKLVLDAAGQPIPEQVEVNEYRYTRKFAIRSVEAGQTYGGWVAPANGALIARTE